ncbi:hypothetical protein B0J15DRAFT_456031 [Fusarium solani]|uniref:Uncharacterized protein n=1 Tax=Fusarium solani TaxID=169388 RepID=A0A9P9JSE4_FUSSL|nr:uncharacterized protein B0J15DRAFT_456031 [Fusarium solani]KAH7231566.1 hypothetical protein B0J15DRAFT_456031 [Fusarium solani]
MASNSDYCLCTICGMVLDPPDWQSTVICLSGPHWPNHQPRSLDLADGAVRRFHAHADAYPGRLELVPDSRRVIPQFEYELENSDMLAELAPCKIFIGIHPACEDLANRVMRTSFTSRVRSIGDLWMTLERRCARHEWGPWHDPSFNFLPYIPTSQPGEPLSFGADRYYVPFSCIVNFGDEWEGWWDHDPINIPDLTAQLLSNLEPICRATRPFPPSKLVQDFKGRLMALPPEIKNELVPWFQKGTISLGCNYIMPQSLWKQIFFQIPFLWDLDIELVLDKIYSEPSETEEWNWEKLTRQILSPAQPSNREYEGDKNGYVWSHETVGLDVPPGFTNRRRIWQILEEMWPNDVDALKEFEVWTGDEADYETDDEEFDRDIWSDDEWIELDLWPDLD